VATSFLSGGMFRKLNQIVNAFQTRTSINEDVVAASWPDLSQVLRHKFSLFTGTHRPLNESDLAYLAEKLILQPGPELKPITFHRFAKVSFLEDN
jgi:hypothetical protein